MENDNPIYNTDTQGDEQDMWELSNCCTARIDESGRCTDCKEHCQTHLDQFKEDDDALNERLKESGNPADHCTAEPEDLMDIMDSQSQRKEMY